MKLVLVFTAIVLSLSAQADIRLCEKRDPFPLREVMKHLSDADYEYEKHIHELKYNVSPMKLQLTKISTLISPKI